MSTKRILVLWDVDRTLLATDGGSWRALFDAGCSIFGESFTLDGLDMWGRPDSAIWREVARANGLSDAGAEEDRFRAAYLDSLKEQQASRSTIRSLPGARELVERLAEQDQVTQAILSGNYPEIGRLKVERAGLDLGCFTVCAWGSDGTERRDLVPVALARYREHTGRPIEPGQVIIIGDTPRDVDCARAYGCRCLAVATGRSSLEALEETGADLVLADLTDTERVLGWICG